MTGAQNRLENGATTCFAPGTRSHRPKQILLLLLLAVLPAAGLHAAPPGTNGSASAEAALLTIEGKVEVARSGAGSWSPGQTNQVLQVGDRVRTGLRSRATVRLSNLTVLRVNELTTLQIQPPSTAGKPSALNLESGAAYFFSRERPTEMEFRTPLASGAIRGTEFQLAVAGDGRTVVTLLDGAVVLTNSFGGLDLASGEEATVEPGRGPTKTAVVDAINIIQWCLYYPAVLDPDELNLSADEKQALAASLEAYRSGELLQALAQYPDGRMPSSDAEKIYWAELLLSVGQVDAAQAQLANLASPSPLADALKEVISAVKYQLTNQPPAATTASQHLADSYWLQAQSKLPEALAAAQAAVAKSPNFGFGWERVAELEFSFGRTSAALDALDKSLKLSPRNAQALALRGFLAAAQNRIGDAGRNFDEAIAVDGALGNAWLGRGLVRIRRGDGLGGLHDLQTAAVLEPRRSLLRSYLGKAFNNIWDNRRAMRELTLAEQLDKNDPTPWLYQALVEQQDNSINNAVNDLEKSQQLNDNRQVYRSRLLLDQDKAVRSANLAQIYRDDGMDTWSVHEASRAVNYDYANYSAHLFLAESYDALRDPNQINLRYETPWFDELLVSELLAPVGSGNLSQYVSQQEYSKLFTHDGIGVSSSTAYQGTGIWDQQASIYGNYGTTSFSVDQDYRHQSSHQRPNNDFDENTTYEKIKQQITPADTLFLETQTYSAQSGDVVQYFDQRSADPTFRAVEQELPNVFVGYHHEWGPGSHTLFLAGHLDDMISYNSQQVQIPFNGDVFGSPVFTPTPLPVYYHRHFRAWTAEAQQIWQTSRQTVVAGARYQTGYFNVDDTVSNPNGGFPIEISGNVHDADLTRISGYGYYQLQIFDPLQATVGFAYDRLHYPANIDTSPTTSAETSLNRFSPKAGFIWSPLPDTHLRGAYTRSVGGLSYDQSVRLEPVQVAGFDQAFRSIAPESVVGLVPGTRFQTWGAALDQAFKQTRTYFTIEGDLLESWATRTVGTVSNSTGFIPILDTAESTPQSVVYRERALTVSVNQLAGRCWSFGARYQLSDAELHTQFPNVPTTPVPGQNNEATMHHVTLSINYANPCGFFARAEGVWYDQSNYGYTPDEPGDNFCQFNIFAGYRFFHRAAEIQLGILNLTDRNYQLNPLNLYNDLPRERTVSALFKFYF